MLREHKMADLPKLPEHLVHLFGCFPFMVQSIAENGQKSVSLNWARLLEAILIAVVGGAFASYLMLRDMRTEFDSFKNTAAMNLQKIEERLEKIDERVYEHMTRQNGGRQ